MIYQLMCDQLPIVGTLVIIIVFFCQEIPTIGIQQTIVCNAKISREKISFDDLHACDKNVPRFGRNGLK